MIENFKKFIAHLQSSDEAAKKRWLAVFSTIAIAAVAALWLPYMDYSISSQTSEPAPIRKENNFWEVFEIGLGAVYGKIRAAVLSANVATIKAPEPVFVPADVGGSPPAILP